VKLLLDTHALLWALARPGELAPEARRRLQDPGNTVFVSVASAWEMEIKRALGKLDAPSDLSEQMQRQRFAELPVHLRHIQALKGLPSLHRDPFDRLLVAQALADELVVVTRDARIRAYPIRSIEC
jgi:PIN domain nuclease of toxin-antitoxin system